MIDITETSLKICPCEPKKRLFKRVSKKTGLRYETLIQWKNNGLPVASSSPALLLLALLDTLAEREDFDEILSEAKRRIK